MGIIRSNSRQAVRFYLHYLVKMAVSFQTGYHLPQGSLGCDHFEHPANNTAKTIMLLGRRGWRQGLQLECHYNLIMNKSAILKCLPLADHPYQDWNLREKQKHINEQQQCCLNVNSTFCRQGGYINYLKVGRYEK